MSKLFYHERYCLTKRQEEVIAALLPAPKAKGKPSLNSLTVFNAILRISQAEPHGEIYLLITEIGAAFIISSGNVARKIFSRKS